MKAAVPFLGIAAVAALAFAALPQAAARTGKQADEAYIQRLPQGQPYRLYVLGDSFASELGDGLKWALRDRKDVVVNKRTKAATGLVRDDAYNWMQVVRELLAEGKANIVVVALGGNDRQDMRVGAKRYERFTEPWSAEYKRRVERLARLLSRSNAAVYWIGLPNVRSQQMTRDYARFNGYFRDTANKHGIVFIDIATVFASANGAYSAYGKAPDGQVQRLRDGDGIHLTNIGAHKLGEVVARKIRADLPEAAPRRSAN